MQPSTPRRRRRKSFRPDIDDGLGSSTWSEKKIGPICILKHSKQHFFKLMFSMYVRTCMLWKDQKLYKQMLFSLASRGLEERWLGCQLGPVLVAGALGCLQFEKLHGDDVVGVREVAGSRGCAKEIAGWEDNIPHLQALLPFSLVVQVVTHLKTRLLLKIPTVWA